MPPLLMPGPGLGPLGYARGGAAPFQPAAVAGLRLWLKDDAGKWQDAAGTTPAVADADPVGRWDDQSGQGNHLTQATAGKRPLLKLAVQNGRAVARFDGADDFLECAGFSLAQPTTVFLVVQDAKGAQHYYYDGVSSRQSLRQVGSVNQFAGGDVAVFATSDTAWHVYASVFSGAASLTTRDGSSSGPVNAGTGALTDLVLGIRTDRATSGLLGDVGEFLVYDSALAAADRQAVEAYLKGRWATP